MTNLSSVLVFITIIPYHDLLIFDSTHNCPANQCDSYNINTAVLAVYESVVLIPIL
jgi:hypothetical protein